MSPAVAPFLERSGCFSMFGRPMTTTVALEVFVGPAVHAHGRGEVTVHESEFTTALVIPAHVHDQPVVSLLLNGVAAEVIDRHKRDLVAQDLLFTPAFEQHAYTKAHRARADAGCAGAGPAGRDCLAGGFR